MSGDGECADVWQTVPICEHSGEAGVSAVESTDLAFVATVALIVFAVIIVFAIAIAIAIVAGGYRCSGYRGPHGPNDLHATASPVVHGHSADGSSRRPEKAAVPNDPGPTSSGGLEVSSIPRSIRSWGQEEPAAVHSGRPAGQS